MYKKEVEIYSDASNFAVMRHPARAFPGALIQGDTLYILCRLADEAVVLARKGDLNDGTESLNKLRNALWDRLNHYKRTLAEHDIKLPFDETFVE